MSPNNVSPVAVSAIVPVKTLALLTAVLITAACASPQKVDRMHSSIYHQQATIQQLEHDMQDVQKQRQQVAAELQNLEANGSAQQEQIEQTREELLSLDQKQSEIGRVMQQMRSSVSGNSQSIAAIESKEKKRRAIIQAQQERWQQITAQTDTKLAEIDQPQLDNRLESGEGGIDSARP